MLDADCVRKLLCSMKNRQNRYGILANRVDHDERIVWKNKFTGTVNTPAPSDLRILREFEGSLSDKGSNDLPCGDRVVVRDIRLDLLQPLLSGLCPPDFQQAFHPRVFPSPPAKPSAPCRGRSNPQ